MTRLTLFHELFHMASTRKKGKEIITGLSIGNIVGTGLDESYTEYMCEKYFNSNQEMYLTSRMYYIIKGLENLVGEKQLEKYYLEGNLIGLINYLSKYIDKKEAIKLILEIDLLNKDIYSRRTYISVVSKIARITHQRLLEDLDNGKLTHKEYRIKKAIQVDEYRKFRSIDNYEIIEEGNYFRIKTKEYKSTI